MAKSKIEKWAKLDPETIIRKYLWAHDKMAWFHLVLNRFRTKIKGCISVAILLLFILAAYDTLADATNSRHFILERVKYIEATLPAVERAFQDIEKLSNSISKVAYKDPDISFIYAFLITKWAKHYNLDPSEVAAIAMTESEFNHRAISHKDARGVMQIHKPSWPMPDYFDAEENIRKGAMILHLYKRSDPGSYLDKYSGGEPNYARKVTKNKRKIENAKNS
jgi:soluble lytic murein transglycosylase-like protein